VKSVIHELGRVRQISDCVVRSDILQTSGLLLDVFRIALLNDSDNDHNYDHNYDDGFGPLYSAINDVFSQFL